MTRFTRGLLAWLGGRCPVEGTGQTHTKFWDEVAVAYSQLKKQQEAYNSHQRKKTKYNKVLLKVEFLSSDDEVDDDEIQVIIPVWTASSLQQKWSKFVQPLVTKFVILMNRHTKKVEKVSCHLLLF